MKKIQIQSEMNCENIPGELQNGPAKDQPRRLDISDQITHFSTNNLLSHKCTVFLKESAWHCNALWGEKISGKLHPYSDVTHLGWAGNTNHMAYL